MDDGPNPFERPLQAFSFDDDLSSAVQLAQSAFVVGKPPSQPTAMITNTPAPKKGAAAAASSRKRPSRGLQQPSFGNNEDFEVRELVKFDFPADILLGVPTAPPPAPAAAPPPDKKGKKKLPAASKTPAPTPAKPAKQPKNRPSSVSDQQAGAGKLASMYCGPSFENSPAAGLIPMPSFAPDSRASSAAGSPRALPDSLSSRSVLPTDGQIAAGKHHRTAGATGAASGASGGGVARQLLPFSFGSDAAGPEAGVDGPVGPEIHAVHRASAKALAGGLKPLNVASQPPQQRLMSKGSQQPPSVFSSAGSIPAVKLAWLRQPRLYLIAPEGGLQLVSVDGPN